MVRISVGLFLALIISLQLLNGGRHRIVPTHQVASLHTLRELNGIELSIIRGRPVSENIWWGEEKMTTAKPENVSESVVPAKRGVNLRRLFVETVKDRVAFVIKWSSCGIKPSPASVDVLGGLNSIVGSAAFDRLPFQNSAVSIFPNDAQGTGDRFGRGLPIIVKVDSYSTPPRISGVLRKASAEVRTFGRGQSAQSRLVQLVVDRCINTEDQKCDYFNTQTQDLKAGLVLVGTVLIGLGWWYVRFNHSSLRRAVFGLIVVLLGESLVILNVAALL